MCAGVRSMPMSDSAPIDCSHIPTVFPASPPRTLTNLVGRGHEVAQVRSLLKRPDDRLDGPKWSRWHRHKIRLALQVAHDVADAFTNGVAFVALAVITEPALVQPRPSARGPGSAVRPPCTA